MGYLIVNLRYHLFIYNCFTAKFQFPMHIPEQLYEIKALIWTPKCSIFQFTKFPWLTVFLLQIYGSLSKTLRGGKRKGVRLQKVFATYRQRQVLSGIFQVLPESLSENDSYCRIYNQTSQNTLKYIGNNISLVPIFLVQSLMYWCFQTGRETEPHIPVQKTRVKQFVFLGVSIFQWQLLI